MQNNERHKNEINYSELAKEDSSNEIFKNNLIYCLGGT